MSKPDEKPQPDTSVPQIDREAAHRKRTADYLRDIARLIERGHVEGFSLVWDVRVRKPIGTVSVDAKAIVDGSDVEEQQKQAQAEKAKSIYTDASDYFAGHPDESCGNPGCPICDRKMSS